jgi:hypothetical protein
MKVKKLFCKASCLAEQFFLGGGMIVTAYVGD